MLRNIILSILLCCWCVSAVYAQYFDWTRTAGGSQRDRFTSIHTDANGGSVVTGFYVGNCSIGTFNLPGNSNDALVIAQYTSTGSVVWATYAGGSGNVQGLGITRDATGNIYVTGYMNGSVTFGSTTITSAGSDDIFIAKYTSAGVLSWVQRIGGGAVDQGFGIATDPSGNILVTGYFTGLVNFGGVSLTAVFYDAFALKLDPTGTVLWAKKGGGSSTDYGSGITSDASGNVYVTGYVYGNGTSTFGGLSATGYGAYDLFVIKYNSTGNEQWLRIGGGVNSDRGYGICTDVAGNVIVTGIFAATATFSTQTLTALGMQDILLLKYTSAGSLVWYRQAGGPFSYNTGKSVISDNVGNIYFTGTFQNQALFGTTTVSSLGLDPFIAKYTGNGSLHWVKRGGGGLDEEAQGIGLDNQGRAYIAGYMQGNQSVFDLNNIVSLGNDDALITRLDSATVAQNPTPLSYCEGDSIIIPFTALADFQFGNVYTAELSDASGSFATPISLGTWTAQGSGSFHGFIPLNTPAGTGYRVRINGNLPLAYGRANTSNITIKALPALPIISSNSPACIGTTLLLSATTVTGASWTWTGPNGFTSSVVTPIINPVSTINAGTYSVFATVNGCVGPVASITVSVTTVPSSITIGANGPICSGNTLQLTASNYTGVNYRWQGPNSFTANTQSVSRPGISLGDAGVYSLYVYAGSCTSAVSTLNLTVNPTPAAATIVALSNPVCQGDSLQLTASSDPGSSFTWNGPGGFSSTANQWVRYGITLADAGTYSVVAYAGTCSATVSTLAVNVSSGPTGVAVTSNAPLCEGATLQIQAGTLSGVTYNWVGPAGFTSQQQNPILQPALASASGVYTLTLNNGCQSAPITIPIQITAAPAASVATSTSPACVGDLLSLKAFPVPGATGYYWIGPNGFSSTLQTTYLPNIALSQAGWYSVYAIAGGCTSAVSVTQVVVGNAVPSPVVNWNAPVCIGDTLLLTSGMTSPANCYWAGPVGWVSFDLNPIIPSSGSAQAGTYSCYCQVNGCTSPTSTLQVTIQPFAPVPQITQSGDTLWANGSSTYQWYSATIGLIVGANGNYYVPTAGDTYWVEDLGNGCPSDTSLHVTWFPVSVQDLIGRSNLKIKVYPNPVNKYLYIKGLDNMSNYNINIYNSQSTLVLANSPIHTFTSGVSEFILPTPLPSGVYYLEVMTDAFQQPLFRTSLQIIP